MLEKEIWEIAKLIIGICFGSYIGTKIAQRAIKKQFWEIIEEIKIKYQKEYLTINEIKTRGTKLITDIETLIKHANKFLGVKQNEHS